MLPYSFGGFSLQSVDPVSFGLVMRQHIMAEVCGGAKALTSWPGCKKRGRVKGWGFTNPSMGMTRRPPLGLTTSVAPSWGLSL